jgi:4-amino-4-deoxy-L-arabinose transferase-like glycosyltransferase
MKPVPVVKGPSLALVALLVFAWFAATAWVRPLLLPDEGRYVAVVWEMLRSGDWMTPTLNGLPFFHKPPLFYWLGASVMAVFGPSEWAGRMGAIVGATLGSWALYAFVRRWCGERTGRMALLVLAVQPLFFIGGQYANLDMLVAGCISATVLLLAHAALCLQHGLPYRAALWGGYALVGLSVLAKGLIGIVLPGGVIVLWLLLQGRWRVLLRLLSLPGLLVFLLLAAPWFGVMQARFPEFGYYFFIVQHFKRFAETGFNNAQPFWFYPVVLAVFFAPWLVWLARAVRPGQGRSPEQQSVHLLMGIWAALIVLFFSMPQSKLVGYVLPAVPALAYFVADGFVRSSTGATRGWQASAALALLVSLGAVAGLAWKAPKSTRGFAALLVAQGAQGDAVFMLDHYYYDLPFYARLQQPVHIVGDWTPEKIALHDNWQKEVADAGAFAPAQAQALLLGDAALAPALCRRPVAWIMGDKDALQRFPLLAQATVLLRSGDTMLWRWERPAQCAVAPL